MRRLRMVVYATFDEYLLIERRANAHGLSLSRFMLTSSLGEPRSPEAAKEAEAWWLGLSWRRKRQIHQFLAKQMVAGAPPGSDPLPFD